MRNQTARDAVVYNRLLKEAISIYINLNSKAPAIILYWKGAVVANCTPSFPATYYGHIKDSLVSTPVLGLVPVAEGNEHRYFL